MHKTTQLSLLVAISSALALTACGGGGSSAGSTTVQPTPVVKPNAPNQAGANPTTPNTTKPNTTNPTGNNAGTKPTTPNTNTPPTTPSVTNPSSPVTPPNTTNNTGTNPTTPNTNTPTPTTPPATGNNSEKPNTPPTTNAGTSNTSKEITGEVGIIDDKVVNVRSDNINKLTVNGVTFELGSPKMAENFSKNLVDEIETHVSDKGMKYARYGLIMDWQNAVDYLFYQGEKTPTANIPTEGTASYVGHSLYLCGDCEDEVIQGTSKFTADFGKKTLTGSISNEQAKVALSATISGNTFSGTNGAGTETRGAFFGDKAQEISGIFNNDDKDFAGAFGATKQ